MEQPEDHEENREQFADFPPISQALIDALESRCAERWPQPGMTMAAIFFRSGQLNIIEMLTFIYRAQLAQEKENNVLRLP